MSVMWVFACKQGGTPTFNQSYGGTSWLCDGHGLVNTAHSPTWAGIQFPGQTYGSKLRRRTSGGIFRRQEMPFTSTAHAVCTFTKVGGRVVDPFSGTGVIGMVCMRTNRPYQGVELFNDVSREVLRRSTLYFLWTVRKLPGGFLVAPTERERAHPYAW